MAAIERLAASLGSAAKSLERTPVATTRADG